MSSLAQPMQPQGDKSAPLPRRGCVGGAGGRGGAGRSASAGSACTPYVHTAIGTSPVQVFEGSTREYLQKERKAKRFKHLARIVYALASCGREAQARALLCCGRFFRKTIFPCGTVKLSPCHCDSVFCPECASRRSKPLQEKIFKRVDTKKYHYFFLTLTVRNWPTLMRDGLNGLIRQFARLREWDDWKEEVRGGVYSLEATYNRETGYWHPHLHVLLECRRALPKDWLGDLKAEWERITGSYVVNLQRMYGGVDRRGRKVRRLNRSGLNELVKYATKTASFEDSPALVDDFLTAFENVRRMQSFGSFLGAVKEAEEQANEEHKPEELAGCQCGFCVWAQGYRSPDLVHISQTVLAFDGTRQLRLLDSGVDPPAEVIHGETNENDYRVAFRAIPQTQTLFDVAPMAF